MNTVVETELGPLRFIDTTRECEEKLALTTALSTTPI